MTGMVRAQGQPPDLFLTIEEFEQRAEETPRAAALELDGDRLSYRELDARANRVARRLQALGAAPDVLVAVCLERSFDLVVALVAVLKAGAAYLPLEPEDPPERLASLIEDARAPIAVTQRRLLSSLSLSGSVRTCVVDDPAEADEIARQEDSAPPRDIRPDQLAYAIYTSGSTGRPKGVLVTHGNLDRLFRATQPLFRFGPEDVWTLFHSCAFDFSVWEMWGALRHGGRLVIVPRDLARCPEAFRELLARTGTTVLNQTPSAFRRLTSEASSSDPLPSLRLVILGGEALEPSTLGPWFDRHGDERPRVVNMYGITETTVHATYRPMTRKDLLRPGVSVIGRPLADLQICILGADGKPCPAGVAGEIHVAGPGVARGYLRRPDLTSERFLRNPFAAPDDGGSRRMYRSGDLGRLLPDGDIEYLGRADQQVKIRGHRIEPAEVEASLRAHPGIRDAAVVAQDDPAGERRLVAYVAGAGGRDSLPTGTALRTFLRRTLPAHMVPAAIVALDTLPLTGNGKLDRGALPAPDPENLLRQGGSTPPEGPVQSALAEIWSRVLAIPDVGADDDFFALGGDSLGASRVMARLSEAFGVELPLRAIFECRTLARLASVIETARRTGTARPARPRIAPVSRRASAAADGAESLHPES